MLLRSHVLSAARRLVNLDEKQVDAVSTRIELDLRIGYAFTRFMTNSLRPLGGPMENLTLSYGQSTSTTRPLVTIMLTTPIQRILPISNAGLRC